MDENQREHHKELCRRRNAWGNVNPHVPEGPAPRDLILRCRLMALDMGLNPGVTAELKLALIQVGFESPELQRSYFHPDYLALTAGVWARSYRNSEKLQEKVSQLHKLTRVD